MATGWTWDYVWETMTFQKLEAFGRMWKRNPPPHVSLSHLSSIVKSYFGIENGSGEQKSSEPVLPGFLTQPDIEE